jgi:hypothetical protein
MIGSVNSNGHKLQCEYGLHMAVNRYINLMEAFLCEDGQYFDGKKNIPFLNRTKLENPICANYEAFTYMTNKNGFRI